MATSLPDSDTARNLALEHTRSAFFLAPTGETFHNVTVTGGRTRAQGPLALKRELNEVQQKVDAAAAELASNRHEDRRTAAPDLRAQPLTRRQITRAP